MRKGKIRVGGRGKRKSTAKLGKAGAKLGKPHRDMQPAPAAAGVAQMRPGKTGSKLGPEHKRRMGRLEKAAL